MTLILLAQYQEDRYIWKIRIERCIMDYICNRCYCTKARIDKPFRFTQCKHIFCDNCIKEGNHFLLITKEIHMFYNMNSLYRSYETMHNLWFQRACFFTSSRTITNRDSILFCSIKWNFRITENSNKFTEYTIEYHIRTILWHCM